MDPQIVDKQQDDRLTEVGAIADEDPIRAWIVRRYGLPVLQEIDRLKSRPEFADCELSDLVDLAAQSAHLDETLVLDAIAVCPCDSSGILYVDDNTSANLAKT